MREETRGRHFVGYSFRLAAYDILFLKIHPTHKRAHTTAFMDHCLEREIA